MHRGEWIKEKIKNRGYSLDELSDHLQIGRTTLWRMTKDDNLPFFKMKLIADALGIDLRNDFPEAASLYEKKEKDYRSLYLEKLEEVTELREELAKYKAKESNDRD